MPKLTKQPPKYSHHRATNRAVVHVDGHDYYLGKYGSKESIARYQRVICEWQASHEHASPSIRPDPALRADLRICELLAAYLEFARGYYLKNGEPTGELSNMKDAIKPINELFEVERVAEFGPTKLKLARDRMVAHGLSRKVVNARVNRIRRIFKWGVENELVDPAILQALQAISPLKKGRTAARETLPVQPVGDDAINKVLEHVTSPIRAMIKLQQLTGMRPCEVVQMRPADIDRSKPIWIFVPATHKTEHHGKERRICLGPKAQRLIIPFLNRADHAPLFDPREALLEHRQQRRTQSTDPRRRAKKNFDLRSLRKISDHYTTQSYYQTIYRACGRAGVPPWGPNRLRHNAGTFLRKEFGIEAVRVILGHASPAMADVYAELDRTKAVDIMAEVG